MVNYFKVFTRCRYYLLCRDSLLGNSYQMDDHDGYIVAQFHFSQKKSEWGGGSIILRIIQQVTEN